MSIYRRMVWTEGMFLGPHHFQQAERHLLGEMDYRLDVSLPYPWGVRRFEIDHDALANGRFNVLRLEGILPDGSVVNVPELDPAPTGRALRNAFTADRATLDVHLALPDERPGTPRTRMQKSKGDGMSRYLGETVRVTDENAPGPDTEVVAAHQNLKLLLEGETLDGHTTLPLARVSRDEQGTMILARDFAPPSLSIRAAGPLPDILRSILENLSARADVLAGQTRHGGDTVQYGTSDVLLFWQLHTVNSAIPLLAHYQRCPDEHPLRLYLLLAGLAGSLCTFAVDRQPREIPAYDHEKVGDTFRALEGMIRDLSDVSTPTRFERIPLERVDEATLRGAVRDERLFGSGYQWYLCVTGDLPEDKIREAVPGKITIGSPHNVEFLVRQALRGVALTYTAVPPRDFPIKAGYVYFRLESQEETWETVCEAREIAIYLRGAELKGLTFELIAMEV